MGYANWLAIAAMLFTSAAAAEVDRIAFGSCLRQWNPQPVWRAVQAADPDLFVFLGDNVYNDTGPYRFQSEPERIARAYRELEQNEEFARVRQRIPFHGTWDDHDYGRNDGGADYPWKQASEQAFFDFFGVPADAPERERDGIYAARHFTAGERRIQLLLLDTRYFRSPLKKGLPNDNCPRINLRPNDDPNATLLGAAQWRWLEQQLRQPADLRLIASSIQVIPDSHCFEKWANFPLERRRLFDLIGKTGANGVVLLSGDRHLGEISRLDAEHAGYPLYEITASGLNSAGAGKGETNRHRVAPDNVRDDHFGLIHIDWRQPDPLLHLELRGVSGDVLQTHQIRLSKLQPAAN